MKAPTWLAERLPFQRSVLILYAARATLGWLVALPLIRVVGESGVATLPNGDASLFQEGALWLIELLREEQRALRAGLATSVVSGLIALAVLCIPSALLFASAPRASAREPAWPRALTIAPRFFVVTVLEALTVGFLLALLAISSGGVADAAMSWFDERGQDIATFVFCVPGMLAAAFAAIVADVARAGLVRDHQRVVRAVSWAVVRVRETAGPLFGGFAVSTGTSALVVALAARATELCRVEQPGAMRVALVLAIHQGALLALVVIQAWWVHRLDRAADSALAANDMGSTPVIPA